MEFQIYDDEQSSNYYTESSAPDDLRYYNGAAVNSLCWYQFTNTQHDGLYFTNADEYNHIRI